MFKILSKVSGRTMPAFWALTAFLALFAIPHANALACGDKITADVTLTADLGPCPNIGIFMDGIPAHVTIDLNGHTIRGKGTTSVGIQMGAAFAGVTIKGPGKIINFNVGVSAGSGAPDIMIYDVTFSNDVTALGLGGEMSSNTRIFSNKIQAGTKGMVGISTSKGGVYIYQNQITGFSLAAVYLPIVSTVTIANNYIAHNGVGVISAAQMTCTVVRGNTVTLNKGNGIQLGNNLTPQAQVSPDVITSNCSDIEDNKVTLNGGNGIYVEPSGEYSPIVQDNIVTSNALNGIEISTAELEGSVTIEGNQVSGSGSSDFFWDGNGTVCWDHNVYGTSSPANLPQCQSASGAVSSILR